MGLTAADHSASKIKFFVQLAGAALELHNFNLLMAVLAGLNFASVQRLKKTWKLGSVCRCAVLRAPR